VVAAGSAGFLDVRDTPICRIDTRTSMFGDNVWIADSTPVESGRSRETAKRLDLAGFAEYGYCASHSRYFWAANSKPPSPLPVSTSSDLLVRAKKPARVNNSFKPLRQTVESVFDTYKGQLDLEQHVGRTPSGVLTRIWQRVLALTAVVWHNDNTGAPIKRSLIVYDH
jgi:hypothetical protein